MKMWNGFRKSVEVCLQTSQALANPGLLWRVFVEQVECLLWPRRWYSKRVSGTRK